MLSLLLSLFLKVVSIFLASGFVGSLNIGLDCCIRNSRYDQDLDHIWVVRYLQLSTINWNDQTSFSHQLPIIFGHIFFRYFFSAIFPWFCYTTCIQPGLFSMDQPFQLFSAITSICFKYLFCKFQTMFWNFWSVCNSWNCSDVITFIFLV